MATPRTEHDPAAGHTTPGTDPAPVLVDASARRRGVVRTALIVAAIALGIYIAFILSGVLNA